MKEQLILASQSPRRRALLDAAGLRYTVFVPDADECVPPEMLPDAAACEIAARKAAAAEAACPGAIIIAADTVVYADGKRLGKPRDAEDAVRMLHALSGRMHTVYTGVCVRGRGRVLTRAERTDVYMRTLSAREISLYVASGSPLDKAGAYGIQEFGGTFVRAIAGDYTNVVGMPMCTLTEMLTALLGDDRYDYICLRRDVENGEAHRN